MLQLSLSYAQLCSELGHSQANTQLVASELNAPSDGIRLY